MAHTLITPTELTRETLRLLHQKVRFISSINRSYDDRFAKSGAKIGDTLRVRNPVEFTVRSGRVADVQDLVEEYTEIRVTTQKGIDWSFSSADLALTIDKFSERYLEPAAAKLAAVLEADALNMYKDINEEISDDGDTMTVADVLEGSKILTDNLCPTSGRNLLLNTRDNVSLVNAGLAIFNPQAHISGQWKTGAVQDQFMGYSTIFESSIMPTHTSGTDDGTGDYLTDIASAEANGSTATGEINIDTGAGSFVAGDIIEIESVNAIHAETKVSLGRRKRFVVTAAATPGSGGGSIFIAPSIIATGARQNVDAAAVDGKIIYKIESDASTAIGASAVYNISLGYHKDAFTFVTADLPLPKGTDMAAREQSDGLALRFVRDFDIRNDVMISRFDVYYGYKTLRRQLAVRYGH